MIQAYHAHRRVTKPVHRAGRWALSLVLALLAGMPLQAQMRRTYPKDDYYLAFNTYLNGDYATARRYFASASVLRSTEGEWIDSIARYAMMGECLYHMGNVNGALEQYTLALNVYLRDPSWLSRVSFQGGLEASKRSIRRPPTWGASGRVIRLARIPDPMTILEGKSDAGNLNVIRRGGVVAPPQYLQVHVREIVRCTALAIRRRGEILGPLNRFDGISGRLITALRGSAPANHWSQAWISAQLGLLYAATGRGREAVQELNKGKLVLGMDHMLTPSVLLALGKLAFQARQYQVAEVHFREATYSAALLTHDDFSQYDVIAEAFRWAMVAHRASGNRQPYTLLTPAAAWAHRGPRFLEASLLLTAAEDYAARNDGKRTAALLDQAARAMRRREFAKGVLGARAQYITAHSYFLAGNTTRGFASLADAMRFQQKGSHWLFQIRLADRLYMNRTLSDGDSVKLFPVLLRDPAAQDWVADPMESLTVLTTPNMSAYEHWLDAALSRKEIVKAMQISDHMRRRRFYASLPLGGRVLNLRWLLEAPLESLPEPAALQRQGLFARYPFYAQLSRQAAQLRAELVAMPPVPDKPDQVQKQTGLMKQLGQAGVAQETLLNSIALGIEPGDPVFPPAVDVAQVQEKLKPGQFVLAFASRGSGMVAFLIGHEQYSSWLIKKPADIRANVAKLFREMGLYDRTQPLAFKDLSNTAWKETAAALLKQLTDNADDDAWNRIEELIIVPDGPIWYVPFAALQLGDGDRRAALINRIRIRYAPTISLAVPDRRPRKRVARTAVVVARLFPRDDETAARGALKALQADDPDLFEVPTKPMPPSSSFITMLDRLIVLSDLDNDAGGPYDWAPMDIDRNKASGALRQWMALPWGGPDQMILPGFHTPAENSLKRGGTGNEVFLAVCGLMATGARTVLISRWRDGGRTTYDLIREFVRELPHRSASSAWQRAVHLAISSELDFAAEPRIKSPPDDTPIKAEHPFFWAGYILVDTGISPK